MRNFFLGVAALILSSSPFSGAIAEDTAAIVKLECKSWHETSSVAKNFEFTTTIPQDEQKQGFVRTGGGCEIDNATTGHRVIVTRSRPKDTNSWLCEAGEQNGTDTTFKITAHVVGCRIVGSN